MSVFKKKSKKHEDFRPVMDWIFNGAGKVVIGGTKMKSELSNCLTFLIELKKIGKLVSIPDSSVDNLETYYKSTIEFSGFDDPHLLALIDISKVKLLCTEDDRFVKILKKSDAFPNSKIPKVYKRYRHKSLLVDENIVDVCKPCLKLTKITRENFPIME